MASTWGDKMFLVCLIINKASITNTSKGGFGKIFCKPNFGTLHVII